MSSLASLFFPVSSPIPQGLHLEAPVPSHRSLRNSRPVLLSAERLAKWKYVSEGITLKVLGGAECLQIPVISLR